MWDFPDTQQSLASSTVFKKLYTFRLYFVTYTLLRQSKTDLLSSKIKEYYPIPQFEEGDEPETAEPIKDIKLKIEELSY